MNDALLSLSVLISIALLGTAALLLIVKWMSK